MYLLYCAAAFALAAIPKRYRFEWSVLAVLSVLTWCNKEIFDRNGDALYVIRACLTFGGAMLLVRPSSLIGFYQAVILLCVLIAYGALAFDVARHEHILIYNNYETVIHGLAICQFLGILPTIWSSYRDLYPSDRPRGKHLQRGQRT